MFELTPYLPLFNALALVVVGIVGWGLRSTLTKFSHLEQTLVGVNLALVKLNGLIDGNAQLTVERFSNMAERIKRLEDNVEGLFRNAMATSTARGLPGHAEG